MGVVGEFSCEHKTTTLGRVDLVGESQKPIMSERMNTMFFLG